MSAEYETLESMCELIVDCPHSTPKWTDEGFLVLRNQNIKNGVLDLSSPSFTNEEDYKKRIKRAVPQTGDIVFTREAPMGEVCIIPEGLQCCLGQRQVLLRPKNSISGKYLFWALQSPFVQHQIAWNEGTGSTVSNVRIPVLKALNIPRHGCDEAEIAKVLSDIASKIEINRQTNQTLEQIAQAIFKSWFVDFEPTRAKIIAKAQGADPATQELAAQAIICGAITLEQLAELEKSLSTSLPAAINDKLSQQSSTLISTEQLIATAALFPNELVESELGEVPESWSIGELENIAEYSSERTPLSELTLDTYISTENMLEGKMGVTRAASLPTVKTVPKFISGDILISNIRPYFKKIWLARYEGGRSNDVLGIKPKVSEDIFYLYNLLYQDVFFDFMMATSTGAKMPRGDKKSIMSWICPKPEINVSQAYGLLVKSFYEIVFNNNEENKILESIRDTLLPKLLSGELTIEAAK